MGMVIAIVAAFYILSRQSTARPSSNPLPEPRADAAGIGAAPYARTSPGTSLGARQLSGSGMGSGVDMRYTESRGDSWQRAVPLYGPALPQENEAGWRGIFEGPLDPNYDPAYAEYRKRADEEAYADELFASGLDQYTNY